MSPSNVKFIAIALGIFSLWAVFLKDSNEYNVNVQANVSAADGLDLKAIGPLLKKAKNAEELEKMLNDPSIGVNNLDLNEDDKVDYINVTEFGEGNNRGFSLSTKLGSGEDIQEIATVQLEKKGDEADVEIRGNEQIYGRGHYYHNRWSGIQSYFLMSYLFRPHPFYRSPWGYGYYPSYYRSYGRVATTRYRSRVSSTKSSSKFSKSSNSQMKSNIKSPNSGKSSTKVRAPLKNPTSSQKSFQKRNPSKRVRSGGFGRTSRSNVRSYSSRRSRGGFGRGK